MTHVLSSKCFRHKLFLFCFAIVTADVRATYQHVRKTNVECDPERVEKAEYEIDKCTKESEVNKKKAEEYEAERVNKLDELLGKQRDDCIEFDEKRADEYLALEMDCLGLTQNDCKKKMDEFHETQNAAYDELLEVHKTNKIAFVENFVDQILALQKRSEDTLQSLEEVLAGIEEGITECVREEKLMELEETSKQESALYHEYLTKLQKVDDKLEDQLCVCLIGLDREMTSDEVVIFEQEATKALQWALRKEKMDCDIFQFAGTNQEVSDMRRLGNKRGPPETRRALKRRAVKASSSINYNVHSTCSDCDAGDLENIVADDMRRKRSLMEALTIPTKSRQLGTSTLFGKKLLDSLHAHLNVFVDLEAVERVGCAMTE